MAGQMTPRLNIQFKLFLPETGRKGGRESRIWCNLFLSSLNVSELRRLQDQLPGLGREPCCVYFLIYFSVTFPICPPRVLSGKQKAESLLKRSWPLCQKAQGCRTQACPNYAPGVLSQLLAFSLLYSQENDSLVIKHAYIYTYVTFTHAATVFFIYVLLYGFLFCDFF